MLTSVISVVLVLGGLIFFHELGHFTIARIFGVGVSTFSLGFGPALISFKRNRTTYKLSAIPLGGYVHMVGEQPGQSMPEGFTEADSFTARPPLARMAIVAAGPVYNFLLAMIIYFGVFWSMGRMAVLPVVGEVVDPSPAKAAGILAGDRVTAIDGKSVTYWEDLVESIAASGGRPLTLVVQRGEGTLTLGMTPEIKIRKNIFGEDRSVPMIGIAAAQQTVMIPLSLPEAAVASVEQTWRVLELTVQGVVKMIERVIPVDNIGGPIMIAQMVSQQAHEGLVNVLFLAALISINLGFLNLLPIPVLDGGHILFFALEAVTGRPLSERWQALTIKIGLSLLLSLMLFAIYNDLSRIFR